MEPAAPHEFVREHRKLIERLTRSVCRRNGWARADTEDFVQHIHVKLLEDDGAVLRRFAGKSSWTGYLAAVIANEFRDERIRRWGKWRPSAVAKRLGPLAVRLEQLLRRDGVGRDEAWRTLRAEGQEISEDALDALEDQLPHRKPRPREVEEEGAATVAMGGALGTADEGVVEWEREARARQLRAALPEAMAQLTPEERLILRLTAEEGLTVATISRQLKVEQKPLYRRLGAARRTLRRELESRGLGVEEVRQLFGWAGLELEIPYDRPTPDGERREPSLDAGKVE